MYSDDIWHYFEGVQEPSAEWHSLSFDDSAWKTGQGGIGYGDADDGTVIDPILSVYLRKEFTIYDLSKIEKAILYMTGSSNLVKNCLIHDFDWLGAYSCPVYVAGSHNQVTRYTIYNGGRDAIRMGGQGHDFSYNDISYSNLINNDCGLIYMCCHDGHGTQLHHNWFHDAQSRGSHHKAAGVYLDNSTQTYDVFNNVIWNLEWSAVQINWDGWNLNIFNNTIWDVGHSMAAWHQAGTWFQDVLVYNNLSNNDEWDGTEYKKNLVLNESPFESLEENASISIFNVLGQRVADLTNRVIVNNRMTDVIWDATGLGGVKQPNGIYIYSVITDDKEISGKVTLLR